MDGITALLERIESVTGIVPHIQLKLFYTIIILIVAPLAQLAVMAIVRRRIKETTSIYRALVATRYTVSILVFLSLGIIWIQGFKDIATYLSIISAGLVIALQDSVSNVAGFLFILWRKPFKVGDRIEIDGIAGDVIDIRAFQFTVVEIRNWVDSDQSTGRIVHIPNRKVMSEPTANFTTGFEYIWHEVAVLVTFESNWQKAKEILTQVANEFCEKFTPEAERQIRKTSQRYMIIAGKLTPIVWTTVRDSGVLLTLRFLTYARSRRSIEQTIWEAILTRFAECDDIDFAYPTTRYYNNMAEGKPGARAEMP